MVHSTNQASHICVKTICFSSYFVHYVAMFVFLIALLKIYKLSSSEQDKLFGGFCPSIQCIRCLYIFTGCLLCVEYFMLSAS